MTPSDASEDLANALGTPVSTATPAWQPIIALLLVGVLPAALLSITVYASERRDNLDEAVARLTAVADVQQASVEQHVASTERLADLAASRPRLIDVVLDPSPAHVEAASGVLDDIVGASTAVAGALVRDVDGRPVLDFGLVEDGPDLQDAATAALTSPDRVSLLEYQGVLTEVAVTPIRDGEDTVGTLTLVLEADPLGAVITDRTAIGETGETLLAVRTPQGEARFVIDEVDGSLPAEVVPADSGDIPITASLAGRESVEVDTVDVRGVPVIAATRTVDATGWGIVVRIDHDEAVAPTRRLAAVLLVGGLVITALVLGLAWWLGRRQRRTSLAALRGHERLRTVLGTAPVAIIMTDAHGEVVYANDEMGNLIGEGDVTVRGLDTLVRSVLDQPRIVSDLPAPQPTGAVFSINARPLRQEDDEVVGVVATIDDVTAERELERQRAAHAAAMRERAEELARSNQDLEQFAYVASHDLQEPLRMITSFMALLTGHLGDDLDETSKEYIHFAVDGATRMRQLINDLLAYSRVNTQGDLPEPTPCDDAVDRTLRNLEAAIIDAGATVEVERPLPEVMADPGQLVQVFQNLVSNAIKFRRDGIPPVVRIAGHTTDDGSLATVTVSDNGIGIDPKHVDRIWVIFQRLNRREDYDGTGLGLAIVKRIMQRNGGDVAVASEVGVGTTFTLTLPTPAADAVGEPSSDTMATTEPGLDEEHAR